VRARLLVTGMLAVPALLGLTGCVSLPEGGPVRSVASQDRGEVDPLVNYTPGGPKQGSAPIPLVDNFLTAMTATPLNTFVAREFLAAESGGSWVPERGTVAYGSKQEISLPHGRVRLLLHDVVELDERGTWQGDPTGGRGLSYDLKLVKERGEWRISHPPNRLIVPRTHLDTDYQQYMLYFFDRSKQVLVPEPVYVPRGPQATTLLVAGLLRGPERDLRDVERSFFPAGTSLDGISVPVSRDGTAEVPLSDDVLDVDDDQLSLLFAQLAWTLGQVSGVERMRVSVGGTPVDLPGSRVDVGVASWSEFDPAVAWSSTAVFGLRGQHLVAVTGKQEQRVGGPLPAGLRSVAVDLPAQHVAAATGDGRSVVEAAINPISGRPQPRTVYTGGTDVLRPAYDLYEQAWIVDRTSAGARVAVVHDGLPRTLAVPGLSGRPVVRFVLSRDGTRLVAQLREDGRDSLVVARVHRDTAGRVIRVGPAVPLPLEGAEGATIRDLAWRTPGSLAVLAGLADRTSQLLVVNVDGSSTPSELSTNAELFRNEALRLVTSPAVGAPLYIGTPAGQLFSLATTGRWTGTSIRAGLRVPTFVG
jgi:hypothetical protein